MPAATGAHKITKGWGALQPAWSDAQGQDEDLGSQKDRGSAWQEAAGYPGKGWGEATKAGEETDFTALNEPESSIRAPSRPCACSE